MKISYHVPREEEWSEVIYDKGADQFVFKNGKNKNRYRRNQNRNQASKLAKVSVINRGRGDCPNYEETTLWYKTARPLIPYN